MNSKNINNFEIDSLAESRKVELVPLTPISYTINTYTVNINQGTESTGDVAYCDVDRNIHCNISITPGAKYKTIKRVLLLLYKSKLLFFLHALNDSFQVPSILY